jgi:putative ABC transport system ATP-binding protein
MTDPQVAGAIETLNQGVRAVPSLRQGFGFTLVLAMIGASGRVVVPVVIQQAIDHGLHRSVDGTAQSVDVSLVVKLCLGAAIYLLIASVAQRTAVSRLGRRSESALYDLRVQLFQHIHQLSLEDHNDEQRGSLVSRVTSDVETLSQFFSWGGLAYLLNGALMIIVAGVMLVYDWPLALLVIFISAPLVYVLRRVQSRLIAAYDASRLANAHLLGSTAELVTGAETLHAYSAGRIFGQRVKKSSKVRGDAQTKATLIGALLFPSGEIFGAIAVSTVVFVGLWRGSGSGLTAGALVGFIFLTYRFLEPIAELTEVLDQTQTAVSGMRRILGILAIPVGPAAAVFPIAVDTQHLDIKIDRLTFSYRPRDGESENENTPVLKDVSCLIPFGTQVAIVGETGSGKTTLGRLLARFSDPTSGAISIGGVPLNRIDNESLRKIVVVVPQEPFLFSDTIAANLRFVMPQAADQQLIDAFTNIDLQDWFETLPAGLETLVGQRGSQLSAGERQLVALVRASLVNPSILILDEATSSVDASTEVRLTRALDRLSHGRTTISIAHRLSTAARADRVLVLDSGLIVQDGSHAQLVDQPGLYSEMYKSWESSHNTTD